LVAAGRVVFGAVFAVNFISAFQTGKIPADRLLAMQFGPYAAKFAQGSQPCWSRLVKPSQARSNQNDRFDRKFRPGAAGKRRWRARSPKRPPGRVPRARSAAKCGTQFRFAPVSPNSYALVFQHQN